MSIQRIVQSCLLGMCSLSVMASEIDELLAEVVASIPSEDLQEPGNPAYAEALQELIGEDLGFAPADQQMLPHSNGRSVVVAR